MSTEVLNETQTVIDGTEFAALADHVLRALHVNPLAELNILFVDPEPMAELHMRWLELPGPTDVMSFPMDELRPGTAENKTRLFFGSAYGSFVYCGRNCRADARGGGNISGGEDRRDRRVQDRQCIKRRRRRIV